MTVAVLMPLIKLLVTTIVTTVAYLLSSAQPAAEIAATAYS